ncbi:hypothetical protein Taro_022026, partial [Colocasia esculenta]|nr:hypothetical protein [Colocasia esculenta]
MPAQICILKWYKLQTNKNGPTRNVVTLVGGVESEREPAPSIRASPHPRPHRPPHTGRRAHPELSIPPAGAAEERGRRGAFSSAKMSRKGLMEQDLSKLDVTKLHPLSPEVISRQATINI